MSEDQVKNVLRVFAEEAKHWEDATDDEPLVENFPGYEGTLTVGDLRRARELLKQYETDTNPTSLEAATLNQISEYYTCMGYKVCFSDQGEVFYALDDNVWSFGGHFSEFVVHPLVGTVRK